MLRRTLLKLVGLGAVAPKAAAQAVVSPVAKHPEGKGIWVMIKVNGVTRWVPVYR